MIRLRSLGLTFVLLLALASPLAAQGKVDYADPDIAVAVCEKLHMAGFTDKSFFARVGPKHHADWKKAAEAGDPAGQWLWGRCLQEGVGSEVQLEQAAQWHRKAAEQGYGLAMNELGQILEQGFGVETDVREAVAWYRKGKAKGNGLAMINLGKALLKGKGVQRDYLEAAKCFFAAVKIGYAEGARGLGEIAEKGRGVPSDKIIAIRWYKEAVAMGSKEAERDVQRLEPRKKETADKSSSGGKSSDKPPGDSKPPTGPLFRTWPAPGIAERPLGPSGLHGPAPVFAGTWTSTLRNEDQGQKETVTFTFDKQGNMLWEGKVPMIEAGIPVEERTTPGLPVLVNSKVTLEYVSLQPSRAEYIVWHTLEYVNGGFTNSQIYLKRYIFTPAGDPDRIKMELWINKGTRPTIQGELVRDKNAKRGGDGGK